MFKSSSSKKTAEFYDELMKGDVSRGILGKDKRYNSDRIRQDPSARKYFVDVIKPYLNESMSVLDFGCGPGSFLSLAAPLCGQITGVDISQRFVESAQQTIADLKLPNATAVPIEPDQLPFPDESFDAVIMMDVVHHLEHIEETLPRVMTKIKPGGRILIFEPNKLNPLIALVHVLDKNEWGLLKLGRPGIYRKILKPFMTIERVEFNGIVIGPQSKIFRWISDILTHRFCKAWLGWLCPKMLITGVKT